MTKAVFIAFDPYPSFKGSAIHIDQVVATLDAVYGRPLVLTLPGLAPLDALHFQLAPADTNYLHRGQAFTDLAVSRLRDEQQLSIGHFRDIWGGLALLTQPHILPIFEVNGFPSIELPYRYGAIAPETLQKLEQLENLCLREAAKIITPSETIFREIRQRGIPAAKIELIPNGANIPPPQAKPVGLPEQYLVYFGAFQPWQGVDVLFRAMKYLQDQPQLKLVVCSSHPPHRSKKLVKFAHHLGIAEQLVWFHQLEKEQLFAVVEHAFCSVAPLIECSRNIRQGCSPLKIFESMACATPVIASNLPVCEEIITHHENGILVRPGRPAELAQCIRDLALSPIKSQQLGAAAQQHIAKKYDWASIRTQLSKVYQTTPFETFFA